MADSTITIDAEILIGDLVREHPKAARVLLEHGLHCIGCAVSASETLEQGAKAHGLDDDEIAGMVEKVNEVINKKIETLEFTPKAIEMVKKIAADEGKAGQGLQINVIQSCCAIGYEMLFTEAAGDGEQTLEFNDLKVYVTDESLKLLKGSEVDYVETPQGGGFAIDNPNAPASDCGCGDSGCGDSGCGDSGCGDSGCGDSGSSDSDPHDDCGCN